MKSIQITKEDLYPLLYFIVKMYQTETSHRQGTSSKSDFIGGFIDRWINKLPENLIFNKLILLNKDYKAITDYFIYSNGSDRNAPDVLGLKHKNGTVKFAEFVDNTWIRVPNMPHIEVKTFKSSQYLVSVRETQLGGDDYYVLVESNIRNDYLLSVFTKDFFNDKYVEYLRISDEFIKSNRNSKIKSVDQVVSNDDLSIGKLELISIIKGDEFMKHTTRCEVGEDVCYIKRVVEVERIVRGISPVKVYDLFDYDKSTGYYSGYFNNNQIVKFKCINQESISICKINLKSLIVMALDDCMINNYNLYKGHIYRVEIELFVRTSSWTEYVGMKTQFYDDKTGLEELLLELDAIYKQR